MRLVPIVLAAAAIASLTACGVATPDTPAAKVGALAASAKRKFGTGLELKGLETVSLRRTKRYKGLLATRVDLRDGLGPVRNQGMTESCFGMASTALAEYVSFRRNKPVKLSSRFVWNRARELEGQLGQNAPIQVPTGMQVIGSDGFVPEAAFPFFSDEQWQGAIFHSLLSEAPSSTVSRQAVKGLVFPLEAGLLAESVQDVKQFLAAGRPVMMAMRIFPQSAMRASADGDWPGPDAGEQQTGGHAMLIVGYDDSRERLIIRNSYGADWGDRGHAYVRYADFAQLSALAWTYQFD